MYQLDLQYGGKQYTYTGCAESLAKIYCQLLGLELYVENNILFADCSSFCKQTIAYISDFTPGDNMYQLLFDNYLKVDFGQESWKITAIAA